MGGKSSRMGNDKSLLKIHKVSQREFLLDHLSQIFETVYFSVNPEQAQDSFFQDKNFVVDHQQYGPASGIWSILKTTQRPIFVMACDMPYFNFQAIDELLNSRARVLSNPPKAICFQDHQQFLHPCFALYEFEFFDILETFFQQKEYSLFKMLSSSETLVLEIKDSFTLTNLNTKEEMQRLMSFLRSKKGFFL